jgi:hypothetical protein
MKNVLAQTYTQTTMRGDGQVVVIPFNSIPVEISPGFRCDDGSIIVCDSNNGGFYRTSSAEMEALELATSDTRWAGNTRALARMLKCWQRENNVALKSFQIERLAIRFLDQWAFSHHDIFWYDWMLRDFFGFLSSQADATLVLPGSGQSTPLGRDWLFQATRAYKHAVVACECERGNFEVLAGKEWQAIFGSSIPLSV